MKASCWGAGGGGAAAADRSSGGGSDGMGLQGGVDGTAPALGGVCGASVTGGWPVDEGASHSGSAADRPDEASRGVVSCDPWPAICMAAGT